MTQYRKPTHILVDEEQFAREVVANLKHFKKQAETQYRKFPDDSFRSWQQTEREIERLEKAYGKPKTKGSFGKRKVTKTVRKPVKRAIATRR